MSRKVELAVVGAGPAGLAAALEARRLGVEVLVVDAYARPGGQFYRQPALGPQAASGRPASAPVRAGAEMSAALEAAGVTIWRDSEVWGVFPGPRLGVDRAGRGCELIARRLIVASGAHDRSLAFPGWTLPGVMTPGCAQTLAKSLGTLPGRRIVVAGSGPFLLAVAKELLAIGAEVAALVEAAHPGKRALLGLGRFPRRAAELARYLAALRRARVPYHPGSAVVEAHGDSTLEAVTIARLGRDGRPLEGSSRRLEVDALAIAYGFRVSSELTSIAGCAHDFDEARGGRFCRVDLDTGATTAAGIFAAGEVTGLAGHRVALEEGRIAGLAAARELGHWDGEAARRLARARRRRRREQRFADFVNLSFTLPAGLAALVTEETVVCRCEDVRAGAIRAAVEEGACRAGAVKMWTRCGMGRCQGRQCDWTLGRYVAALTGQSVAEVGINAPRIPVRPVPLGVVLEGESSERAPAGARLRP